MSQDLPSHERWAILEWSTGRPREWFIARPESEWLSVAEAPLAGRLFAARAAGQPLAYLLGEREFYGRRFWIRPGVLIPRADSELLVDAALETARNGLRVLDLGCGSGCLGISIALELRARGLACSLTMVDTSPEAVATSRDNAQWLGVDAEVMLGDWWGPIATNGDGAQPVARRTHAPSAQNGHDASAWTGAKGSDVADHKLFDLVVSNPPYVRPDDPHLQVGDLRFEPAQALVGHAPTADGLADYRRILLGVPAHLAPGGMLLLEHGHDQQSDVLALVGQAGLVNAQGLDDLSNRPRAVRAFAPPLGHYD